jgi:hypothetical protein
MVRLRKSLQERPWLGLVITLIAVFVLCVPALEHAFFDLDDYRYLHQVRRIAAGEGALWQATVVENRWDDVWWVPDGTFVRFFRPPVILSYWLDGLLWGEVPFGYVFTNVLLHVIATALLWACLWKMFGRPWLAFFGGLAFGLQASHWENLAYVAGRTDTLAALPVLTAVLLHLATRGAEARRRGQLWTAALCFTAFLAKEYTVVLPPLLVLLDALHPPEGRPLSMAAVLRRNTLLLLASTLLFCLYLALRHAGFSPEGAGGHPYPYFYLPWREGFAARTGAALLQYAHGLAAGQFIQPFLNTPDQLAGAEAERVLSTLWVSGLLTWGVATREGRWLASLFAITLLPLLLVYTSGRYLYLPTIGYCGLLGLAIDRLPRSLEGKLARTALATLMIALPALRLGERFAHLPRAAAFGLQRPGVRALAASGLDLSSERPLFLLEFPGTWFEMQFAAVALARGAELPALHFLTARPATARAALTLTARVLDDHTLELSREGAPLNPYDPGFDFDHTWLARGASVRRAGYTVEVLEAEGGRPLRARVRFDVALSAAQLHAFPGARIVSAPP